MQCMIFDSCSTEGGRDVADIVNWLLIAAAPAQCPATAWKWLGDVNDWRRLFTRHLDKRPRTPFRIGIAQDVRHDSNGIRARREHARRTLQSNAADRDERQRADAALPFADRVQSLRREAHLFQDRRIDRTERDVIWFGP